MRKSTTLINIKRKLQTVAGYVGLITYVAFYFVNSQACAAENLAEKYHADLAPVELYLNNIKNLSSKFIQESEGNLVEGKFFLARSPESSGKMRIEYLTQPQILIVVNASVLSYYDVELDEISHLSTNTTPASFLTRPNISFFAKDVEVTDVKKTADQIKISVMKKNRKDAGEFSLVFDLNPLRFIKMEVKNDLGQIIGVTLTDIDFNSAISDKLFVIKTIKN